MLDNPIKSMFVVFISLSATSLAKPAADSSPLSTSPAYSETISSGATPPTLDLFGLSIGLWIISETLFRFWSPAFRWLSGSVGFLVAAVFGIFPQEIFANLGAYWWIILFWLPALFARNRPNLQRKYTPWLFLGMFSYMAAFAIWLQGYPDTPYCEPDSWIQPHAIWHLLSAVSTWCFLIFYRTEQKR